MESSVSLRGPSPSTSLDFTATSSYHLIQCSKPVRRDLVQNGVTKAAVGVEHLGPSLHSSKVESTHAMPPLRCSFQEATRFVSNFSALVARGAVGIPIRFVSAVDKDPFAWRK